MREVGASEARMRLAALLDLVEQGEEVMIARRGKTIARLVPLDRPVSLKEAQAAAWRIRAMSKGVTLRGLRIKDLIHEDFS